MSIHQDTVIRQHIWLSLSEFYLDTELTDEDLNRIATAFFQSGLGLVDIKNIDMYEVFPVVQTNLLSVAGSWDGFNRDWLFSECEKKLSKRQTWFHRNVTAYWTRLFYSPRKDYWNRVKDIFINLKATKSN